jgi:AcrR family transcriptional regulator
MYPGQVPKLWNETIETHRHAVREAILDTTWELVAEHGPLSVTMSQIAEKTGIGRATLYKYFPDVEAILVAYHDRRVTAHLRQLAELHSGPADIDERLEAVLTTYALICHHRGRHGPADLAALLHRPHHVAHAQQLLVELFQGLLTEAAEAGRLRGDAVPEELASYCLHALGAAGGLPDEAAVHRLVAVTLTGLRSPR